MNIFFIGLKKDERVVLFLICFTFQIATAIENYAKGKPVVEVTKIARRKCPCGHGDCACGVGTSVTKADCPCECAGQCR